MGLFRKNTYTQLNEPQQKETDCIYAMLLSHQESFDELEDVLKTSNHRISDGSAGTLKIIKFLFVNGKRINNTFKILLLNYRNGGIVGNYEIAYENRN